MNLKNKTNNKSKSYLLSGIIVWPPGFSVVKEHLLLPSSADTASLVTLKKCRMEQSLITRSYNTVIPQHAHKTNNNMVSALFAGWNHILINYNYYLR